jgi:predicted HAD superfamily Cof-like phosphohydrolase
MMEFLTRVDEVTAEFNRIFGNNNATVYVTLVEEEFKELVQAVNDDKRDNTVASFAEVLKEFIDLFYVVGGFYSIKPHNPTEVIKVVTLMTLAAPICEKIFEGIPTEYLIECLEEVHRSNLSKMVDGKVLRRDDGKVMKGPNYSPANLLPISEQLLKEGRI